VQRRFLGDDLVKGVEGNDELELLCMTWLLSAIFETRCPEYNCDEGM
jgi:hypothetical protein